MQPFSSLGAFALHLATIPAKQHKEATAGLKKVAKAIEKTAKEEFGVYQPSVGAFEAWKPLAEATKEDRSLRGYSEDEPLLRTGKLRDSISHEVTDLVAVVGSTSDVMLAQELGTPKIPPRAVLGPAAIRNKQLIQEVLGHALLKGLLPDGHSAASANYNHNV